MPSPRYCPLMLAVSIVALSLLSGCAGTIPAAPKDQRAPTDPWEPLNRRLMNFNQGVDKVTFNPLAKGYQQVVPNILKQGVGNFSSNLRGPLNIINNILQGKFQRGVSETGRFLVNSTLGVGGLIDVGTHIGLESHPENFGETFAVWGIPDGPYVVVPIFGPRTLSGTFAIPLNFLADPLFYLEDDRARLGIYALRATDLRARLFVAEALMEDSVDRYLTLRESFLQNRTYRIYDGDPPEDEELYDEFIDEENPEEEQ